MERQAEPPVAVTPPPAAPPVVITQRTSKAWTIGIPIAIVVLIGIIWAVVAGMPFSRSQTQSEQSSPTTRPSDQPAVDTIAEGSSTATTASIGDTSDMQSQQPVTPPPMTNVVPPPAFPTATSPAAVPVPVPMPAPRPVTTTTQPPVPPREQTQTQVSETEARAILARYLDGRDPYHTPGDCLVIRGTGFLNRGYGFDVFDHCQSQRLGSWRVDAVTRELFEQKADGRYLRP